MSVLLCRIVIPSTKQSIVPYKAIMPGLHAQSLVNDFRSFIVKRSYFQKPKEKKKLRLFVAPIFRSKFSSSYYYSLIILEHFTYKFHPVSSNSIIL